MSTTERQQVTWSARRKAIGSPTYLLVALVLLFIATPFIDRMPSGEFIERVAVTLVLLAATFVVGGRARSLGIALVLVAPALGARWIEQLAPGVMPSFVAPASAGLFMALVSWRLLAFVLRAPEVNHDVVCAGIATYLMIGLLWTSAYMLESVLEPGAFATFGTPMKSMGGLDAFYFSFITLIGIGYGDITPVSRVAQMLAVLEGITSVFFMVIVIARLVTHYTPQKAGGAK